MTGGVDVDVVVAGAGAAGAVAALRVARAGRSCLLTDASPTFPRSANIGMSAGMIPACGTRLQREAGVDDGVEVFVGDIQRKAAGQAPEPVVRALAERSAALVDWLCDEVGLPLALVTDFVYPGHTRPRCHSMPDRSGASLHAGLLSAVRRDERIDLVHPLQLVDVEEGADGGPVGAVLRSPDGVTETVRTRAVILCTGGFGADRELVARHLGPEAARLFYHGAEGSGGDAVRTAASHGWDLSYLDSFQGHGSLSFVGVPLTWATMVLGGILVDRHGARYGNELRGYSEFAVLTAAAPDGYAWAVFDEAIAEELRRSHDFRVITAENAVVAADSPAALADRIGADPATLERTLTEVADLAARRATDRFGRSWERPLGTGLRAVRVRGALFHTQGGITVDPWARVLRGGRPVPGVYAAGGAAAGISGHGDSGYLAGNGLLSAMGLGMIAADHATAQRGGTDGDA